MDLSKRIEKLEATLNLDNSKTIYVIIPDDLDHLLDDPEVKAEWEAAIAWRGQQIPVITAENVPKEMSTEPKEKTASFLEIKAMVERDFPLDESDIL
jgi:hypothetical protein